MAGKIKSLQAGVQVFGSIAADRGWTPAVNVYDCGASLRVCVELAGVPRSSIEVTVQLGRLVIEGRREVPEPSDAKAHCLREMEIDHGAFRRVLGLPESIDLKAVSSSYTDGMLWIVLPIRGGEDK
ncbi:MAG: Hsp20/alpha crystallin family protein [Phycisphaeraceae bacterium]